MRIQEKLDNLVRLVTGNKFGAADEYINQIKNEYNQMAHERDQYNEKAENEKLAREYALKYAEKLDEKVEEKEKTIEELDQNRKDLENALEEKQAALNTMHDLYAKCSETIREMSEEYAEMVKNAEHHKHQAEHWKTCHYDVYEDNDRLQRENAELKDKLQKYEDIFNQPLIPMESEPSVERLVPMSELERERENFNLLEKAILDANKNDHASTIFAFYHLNRQHKGKKQ